MAKYYILVDIDQKGNWYAGVPYQDKLNAFNSGARYPGNAVTPYAQFIVINLPSAQFLPIGSRHATVIIPGAGGR